MRTQKMSETAKGLRRVAKGLVLSASILIMTPASAWDGSVTGLIAGADVTDGPGYEFRTTCKARPGYVAAAAPLGLT